MGSLLIDEEPLLILPNLAAVVGLNEAIVLQQLHYWLRKSRHEHDGRVWVYNTLAEWQVQFPFWNEPHLQRTMKSLVDKKLVVVHRFNKQNWDRTNWYSIEYDTITRMERQAEETLKKGREKKLAIETKRRLRGGGPSFANE